jgi:hypothetical protein
MVNTTTHVKIRALLTHLSRITCAVSPSTVLSANPTIKLVHPRALVNRTATPHVTLLDLKVTTINCSSGTPVDLLGLQRNPSKGLTFQCSGVFRVTKETPVLTTKFCSPSMTTPTLIISLPSLVRSIPRTSIVHVAKPRFNIAT